jgi:hypothetical protein
LNTASPPQRFRIVNNGAAPLPIVTIKLTGTDRAMFQLTRGCGSLLAVGASCAVQVAFQPTSLGIKTARLRVVAGNFELRARNITGVGSN